MKKAQYVYDKSREGTTQSPKLQSLEGIVTFSEKKILPLGTNLTLKIEDGSVFWVRGEHRIDVGEVVILHYQNNSQPCVADAYEILAKDGNVKHRYCDPNYEFVD
jgi:hypothetical protein